VPANFNQLSRKQLFNHALHSKIITINNLINTFIKKITTIIQKNLNTNNHKTLKEQKIIQLRLKGYSYGMIMKEVKLSKSTLSAWLKELPFKPNDELIKRIGAAKMKSALFKHEQRRQSIFKAHKEAKKELGKISERDLLFLGIGLYMGEGSKLYEQVRLINSDPKIILLTIKWLKKICGLDIINFSLTIHIYPDTNENKAINFWSKISNHYAFLRLLPFGFFLVSLFYVSKLFKKWNSNFYLSNLAPLVLFASTLIPQYVFELRAYSMEVLAVVISTYFIYDTKNIFRKRNRALLSGVILGFLMG
jgi:hypothetical protein